MMRAILSVFFLAFLLWNCKSGEIADESFSEKNSKGYVRKNNPKAKDFLQELEPIFGKYVSYKGEFSLQIQTQKPNKQNVFLDGKILLSQESGKVKIQLMDQFLGMVFSELIATRDTIEMKNSQTPKPIVQPMGDILLIDPNTQKTIVLPFPIIYQYLTGDFRKEISLSEARFLPEEKRILLEKKDGTYEYFFSEFGLDKIELTSPARGLKALSTVKERDPGNLQPPKSIVTKVSSLSDEKETAMVLIQMKKVIRTSLSDSQFQF